MRRLSVVLTMAASLTAMAADPHMTAEERAHAVKLLEDSSAEFLASIRDVTPAQWTWKSAPDRWSVGETAEHIVLAEGLLFSQVTKALGSPVNPEWEDKTKGK